MILRGQEIFVLRQELEAADGWCLGYGLDNQLIVVQFPAVARCFTLLQIVQQALGLTLQGAAPEKKRPRCEAEHPTLSILN
jgi:hypothetical protein